VIELTVVFGEGRSGGVLDRVETLLRVGIAGTLLRIVDRIGRVGRRGTNTSFSTLVSLL